MAQSIRDEPNGGCEMQSNTIRRRFLQVVIQYIPPKSPANFDVVEIDHVWLLIGRFWCLYKCSLEEVRAKYLFRVPRQANFSGNIDKFTGLQGNQ